MKVQLIYESEKIMPLTKTKLAEAMEAVHNYGHAEDEDDNAPGAAWDAGAKAVIDCLFYPHGHNREPNPKMVIKGMEKAIAMYMKLKDKIDEKIAVAIKKGWDK